MLGDNSADGAIYCGRSGSSVMELKFNWTPFYKHTHTHTHTHARAYLILCTVSYDLHWTLRNVTIT